MSDIRHMDSLHQIVFNDALQAYKERTGNDLDHLRGIILNLWQMSDMKGQG
jgi:hypothetical protein